jgi:flagellar protein FliJ
MKRYTFRFQRLLELKERVEAGRKNAFVEAMAVLHKERERFAQLQEIRRRYQQVSRIRPATPLNPVLLELNTAYLQRLQQEIDLQQAHLRKVEAIVEDRRQKLLAATKERRVFEILKERGLAAHRSEQRRREQIMLDEVGRQLYVRQENGIGELDA